MTYRGDPWGSERETVEEAQMMNRMRMRDEDWWDLRWLIWPVAVGVGMIVGWWAS